MPPDHRAVVEWLAGPCCEDQVWGFARDIGRASSAADTRRDGRWAQIQVQDYLSQREARLFDLTRRRMMTRTIPKQDILVDGLQGSACRLGLRVTTPIKS